MGFEVRKVKPGWSHPLRENARDEYDFKPLYDETFEEAAAEWKREYAAWESGGREQSEEGKPYEFWEWCDMPPEREFYREAWSDEEATMFQAYENVTEGTPISPAFASLDELAVYLSEEGDYRYQAEPHNRKKPTLEQARSLVRAGA